MRLSLESSRPARSVCHSSLFCGSKISPSSTLVPVRGRKKGQDSAATRREVRLGQGQIVHGFCHLPLLKRTAKGRPAAFRLRWRGKWGTRKWRSFFSTVALIFVVSSLSREWNLYSGNNLVSGRGARGERVGRKIGKCDSIIFLAVGEMKVGGK